MISALDLFSGYGGFALAMHRAGGFRTVAFSEIDKFVCAILAERFPGVPNWGDINDFQEWPHEPVDLVCGGSPCQSFSVAGLRKGLDDPRGNLAMVYLSVVARYRPAWVLWENVPGVLSADEGRAFGSFLGALAQLGYGWAYRSLDAQYDGLAQRRERVFVVGCLGDWRGAAAVLFEPESLRGDPPPRRETGQDVAGTLASRTGGGGFPGTDKAMSGYVQAVAFNNTGQGWWNEAGVSATVRKGDENGGGGARESTIVAYGGNNTAGPIDVATACNAKGGSGRMDFESETFIAHTLRGEGFDASEDGTGRGTPLVPVAFSCKDYGADAGDISPTLRAMGHGASHANSGGQVAVTVALRGRDGGATAEVGGCTANALRASTGGSDKPFVLTDRVRRLMPIECERLQGLPDDWTRIPWRGKPAELCPDGPRYKAIGNGVAVPVVEWIARRIRLVDEITKDRQA